MAMDFGMPAISASISTASTLKLIIALATIALAFGVIIPITDIANTLFVDIPMAALTALTTHSPASGTHQLCPPLCT